MSQSPNLFRQVICGKQKLITDFLPVAMPKKFQNKVPEDFTHNEYQVSDSAVYVISYGPNDCCFFGNYQLFNEELKHLFVDSGSEKTPFLCLCFSNELGFIEEEKSAARNCVRILSTKSLDFASRWIDFSLMSAEAKVAAKDELEQIHLRKVNSSESTDTMQLEVLSPDILLSELHFNKLSIDVCGNIFSYVVNNNNIAFPLLNMINENSIILIDSDAISILTRNEYQFHRLIAKKNYLNCILVETIISTSNWSRTVIYQNEHMTTLDTSKFIDVVISTHEAEKLSLILQKLTDHLEIEIDLRPHSEVP